MSQGSKSASLKGQVVKQAADTNYPRTTQSGHATQKPLISYTQEQKEHPKKKRMQQKKSRKVYISHRVPTTLPTLAHDFWKFPCCIDSSFFPSVFGDLSGHLHGFQDGHEPSKIPAVGT